MNDPQPLAPSDVLREQLRGYYFALGQLLHGIGTDGPCWETTQRGGICADIEAEIHVTMLRFCGQRTYSYAPGFHVWADDEGCLHWVNEARPVAAGVLPCLN